MNLSYKNDSICVWTWEKPYYLQAKFQVAYKKNKKHTYE